MSPRAERAAQRHARNAAVMVQAHWRGNRARVAYRALRGAQPAAEAPAPSPVRHSLSMLPLTPMPVLARELALCSIDQRTAPNPSIICCHA